MMENTEKTAELSSSELPGKQPTKRVYKKRKTGIVKAEDSKKDKVAAPHEEVAVEEKQPSSAEKAPEVSASPEDSTKDNKKQNFQKKNNKNNVAKKNNNNNNANVSPHLQRYRWWMGQLYQWRNVNDLKSLDNLVSEITNPELPAFLLNEWYEKPLKVLLEGIPQEAQILSLTRQSILLEKMREASAQKIPLLTEGVVAKVGNTEEWSVCYSADNYQLRDLSAYLPKILVRKYGLRPGQTVRVQLYVSATHAQCPCVVKLISVMGQDPEAIRTLPHFKELIPYYPTQRILLETEDSKNWDNNSMRIVDLLTPIGFGQRGLIVAPPRTGKTILLQNIANSIAKNQPQAYLIILLIDERPEEVTDFKNLLPGIEVISSTFDEAPESHVRAAEIVIEKAKRLVEIGSDVIILLDSITRLARAYNTIIPSSGKVLSGGVEANALQGPKAFFGAARNIEQGGSLTILATALIDTGSKMDEVIFEEFKGTGNMELHLDRSLIDKRIFPAINIEKSGTRKEELLYHPDELLKIYSLRRAMKGIIPSTESMEMLLDRIRKTHNNIEFLMSINS